MHEVIQSKIGAEDQLRQCPLTFRDLEQIEQSFLMVLSGMNHLRVSYGNEQDKAIEQALRQSQLAAANAARLPEGQTGDTPYKPE